MLQAANSGHWRVLQFYMEMYTYCKYIYIANLIRRYYSKYFWLRPCTHIFKSNLEIKLQYIISTYLNIYPKNSQKANIYFKKQTSFPCLFPPCEKKHHFSYNRYDLRCCRGTSATGHSTLPRARRSRHRCCAASHPPGIWPWQRQGTRGLGGVLSSLQ